MWQAASSSQRQHLYYGKAFRDGHGHPEGNELRVLMVLSKAHYTKSWNGGKDLQLIFRPLADRVPRVAFSKVHVYVCVCDMHFCYIVWTIF